MSHHLTKGSLATMAKTKLPPISTMYARYAVVIPDGGFAGFATWLHDETGVVLPVAYPEDDVIEFAQELLGSERAVSILDAIYGDWEPELVDGPAGC